jgi:hypothetical protein
VTRVGRDQCVEDRGMDARTVVRREATHSLAGRAPGLDLGDDTSSTFAALGAQRSMP